MKQTLSLIILTSFVILKPQINAQDGIDVLERIENSNNSNSANVSSNLETSESNAKESSGPGSTKNGNSFFDRIYEKISKSLDPILNNAVLIQGADKDFIKEATLSGRYHWQNADINADQGDDQFSESRRARLGAMVKLMYDIDIKGEINLVDEDDVSSSFDYGGIDTLYASWSLSDNTSVSVGKMKPLFTQEYTMDSNELPVLERSLLVKQLAPYKSTGVNFSGKSESWAFSGAVFSGEKEENIGWSSDGLFYNASLTYEFNADGDSDKKSDVASGDLLGREFWHLDYIYNPDSTINDALGAYEHAISTGVSLERGNFGLSVDLNYATGDDALWGLQVTPTLFIIEDKIQLVGRYQFADTDDSGAINLSSRYENSISDLVSFSGDEYHSLYAGINYYLYDNHLKLMTGIEFSVLKDNDNISDDVYNGWTWLSGLRISF